MANSDKNYSDTKGNILTCITESNETWKFLQVMDYSNIKFLESTQDTVIFYHEHSRTDNIKDEENRNYLIFILISLKLNNLREDILTQCQTTGYSKWSTKKQ